MGRNKTIVKRNSEGQKSVFWSDFYDDNEYGIKIDYSDNIRNKHCVKNAKNIVQQSKDWFRRGFKNLTQKIKGRFTKKPKTTAKKINITTNLSKSTSKLRFVRQTNNVSTSILIFFISLRKYPFFCYHSDSIILLIILIYRTVTQISKEVLLI